MRPPGAPPRVAITGGIGSGKSAALAVLAELGAAALSSDAVVHELYADPEVVAAVAAIFGEGVVDPAGSIDRARVGERVFADPDARRQLEGVLHPRIGLARERWMERHERATPPAPALACEVPLLFEVGLTDRFDRVMVISASEAVRRARVEARGQDFDRRAAAQWPESRKIAHGDDVYLNDGTPAQLRDWVERWWRVHVMAAADDDGG